MVKTIILNQGTLHPDYQSVDDLSYTTWGSTKNPNVKVINYYGKYEQNGELTNKFSKLPEDGEVLLYNNTMICGTYDFRYPSSHPQYIINQDARSEKFIMVLEYCLKNFEFDYIQRISNTSYVDVEKMQLYLNDLPRNKIYNGARNMYNYQYYFVAGHDVIMSRDVVELLVNNKHHYLKSPYPEDLAVGKLLMHDIKYVSFEDQSKDNFVQIFPYDIDIDSIDLEPNPSVWCYRIGKRPEIFKHIHKLILERDNA
jgi:hypothetical protein